MAMVYVTTFTSYFMVVTNLLHEFQLIPSGHRYIQSRCGTNGYQNYSIPGAVVLLNKSFSFFMLSVNNV